MYYVLARTSFSILSNFPMSISCLFQCIHHSNQLDQSPHVKNLKIGALTHLEISYTNRYQQKSTKNQGKWIEMARQLHNDADSAKGIDMRMVAAEVHMFRFDFTLALQEFKQCLELCAQKGYSEEGAIARLRIATAL